jgi:tetratricopeptide (TPR) repeat protein
VLDVQGKYQDAIGAFRAATVAAPASALAFSNLGEVFLKVGNFSEARGNFEKSLRLKPNALAYSNMAETLRAEGNFEAALTFSEKAVELDPSDDRNWLDLADGYECLPGRQTQAREAYRRAAKEVEERLRTDPTEGSAWIWLALYRVKSRSGDDALPLIAKATGVSDVDSELAKARVFELLGKRQEAIATLTDCFAKGTTVFEVSSIGDFAALRSDPRYLQMQKVKFHGGAN